MSKVLFISHYSTMYGANQSLCQLMMELRLSYDIQPIVLLPNSGPICKFLDKEDIKYYVSHYYWWVNSNQGLFQKLLNLRKQGLNLFRISRWSKLLANEKIELVYTNSVTINIGVFLSKKLHVPHIWHIRESLTQFRFKLSLGTLLSKMILKRGANNYISISDFISRSYVQLLPINKIVKIYNGVNINTENRKHNNFGGILNICILGIISEQKNQLDALKAIKVLIKDKGIKNIKLHIIGGAKDEYLKSLQEYIKMNELSISVLFYGHMVEVNTILRSMNLGLMCSRDEAFGRVTIEYMLNRLPVIASRSGANQELVKDGVNGKLYDLYNVEELAEKIGFFIKNSHYLEKMGGAAKNYAQENYSSRKNADAVYKLISGVLN